MHGRKLTVWHPHHMRCHQARRFPQVQKCTALDWTMLRMEKWSKNTSEHDYDHRALNHELWSLFLCLFFFDFVLLFFFSIFAGVASSYFPSSSSSFLSFGVFFGNGSKMRQVTWYINVHTYNDNIKKSTLASKLFMTRCIFIYKIQRNKISTQIVWMLDTTETQDLSTTCQEPTSASNNASIAMYSKNIYE